MPETYYIRLNAVDVRPLEDAFLAIENKATDARAYFELVNLRVSPAAPSSGFPSSASAATGRSGLLGLYRISALSGGDAITPSKFDTNSASLPSQVSAVVNPNAVTTTSLFRQLNDCPVYGGGLINIGFSSKIYGGTLASYRRANFSEAWRGGESADVEPIILRAGEGIALTQEAFGLQHAMIAAIVITNTATGATYMVRSANIGTDRTLGGALIAVMNGSGSGVTLSVKMMFLPADGESYPAPPFRLCRIAGLTVAGDPVTPIAADTANTAPASLVVSVGPMQPGIHGEWQQDYYTRHGTPYFASGAGMLWLNSVLSAGTISRRTYANIFPDVGIGNAIGLQSSTTHDCTVFSAASGSGLIIEPGQSLGLVGGASPTALDFQFTGPSSTFHNYDIEATILYYPPPSAPAGGNTYSRSRVVNR